MTASSDRGGGRADVRRVLIAARGALAPRLIGAYRAAGLETVVAFGPTEAEADYLEDADFDVWLGDGEPDVVWSDATRIVSAALDAGCDGIHPGVGPLARSLDLCSLATAANVGLIGIDAPRGAELLDVSRIRAKLQARGLVVAVHPEQRSEHDARSVVVASDRHGTIVVLGGVTVMGPGHGGNPLLAEMGPNTASEAAQHLAEEVVRTLGFVGVGSVSIAGEPIRPSFVDFEPHLPRAFELVELVHGIDLIEAQLRVALGAKLGWSAADAKGLDRYGIMTWISAIDEGSIDTISVSSATDGRTSCLVHAGSAIAKGCDPVLATIAVRATERAAARSSLRELLDRAEISGVSTDRAEVIRAL